jgi:hypothetical protein
MPFIVVRLPGRHAGSERQDRLRPIQRLYLTLLVNTENDRMLRRIHVQSDDVPYLLDKLRVFGEFEVLLRCCNPNARQMHTIAVCDSPVFLDISRLLSSACCFLASSPALVMTASTSALVIDRGAPGRGSASSPPAESLLNLWLQPSTI